MTKLIDIQRYSLSVLIFGFRMTVKKNVHYLEEKQ